MFLEDITWSFLNLSVPGFFIITISHMYTKKFLPSLPCCILKKEEIAATP